MPKRQSKNKTPPLNITQSVNIGDTWDSAAFAKLLKEQAKSNETAIKQLETAMGAASANQQQLAEQIAQTSMMKDIKEALIAQLQDRKFEQLKQEQIKLKELEKDPKISEVSKTINVNYGTYYECAVKVDTWIEWYHSQKKIFDNIGK